MRFASLTPRFLAAPIATAAALLALLTPAIAQTFNGDYVVDDETNTGPQVFSNIEVGVGDTGTFSVYDGRLVRSTSTIIVARATATSAMGIVNVFGNHSRIEGDVDLRIAFNNLLATRTAIGTLNIEDGGHVRALVVRLSTGNQPTQATVNVSGPGSLLEVTSSLEMNQSATRTSTVTIGTGGTVSVGTTIDVFTGSPQIILDGGTLSLTGPSAVPAAGIIQFNSGAFRFRSAQTLNGAAGFYTTYFGSPPVLAAGRGLVIDGTTTLATTLRIDGGSLRTDRIAVNPASGSLLLHGGTLTLTGDGAVLDSGADFGPSVLIVGDGAGAAARLEMDGAGDVLLGHATIAADGSLTFAGTTLFVDSLNSAGRVTIAESSLYTGAGLLNTGSLGLADTVVEGNVDSPAGSTIDVAGTVVFNGGFTGAAAFYGSGTVVFNGPVSID
ncbi:MAG TPA: hypothetical protein VJV23_07795 [Candidatus Polarisedimenticolia bacterium]|nr:hypothetical protein [Candidatus Polarisedimenticolia bacterium]